MIYSTMPAPKAPAPLPLVEPQLTFHYAWDEATNTFKLVTAPETNSAPDGPSASLDTSECSNINPDPDMQIRLSKATTEHFCYD